MEQVELSKTDVEKKVERILKLIKRRSKKKEPEIITLIEEFHRQYQSLYSQYEYLKRNSGERTPKGEGNESYPYYVSGQESEYYSPTDVETETDMPFDNNRCSHRCTTDNNIKEELKRAYGEDVDMTHQLASKTEEKEALASDHLATSSKTQGMENEVDFLRAQQRGGQAGLSSQKEVMELESKVDAQHKQKIKSEDELRSRHVQEINQLREEKSHLNARILELEEEQKLKMLKDHVIVLENRVGELEKINKEKDEALLSRDEEKREAIRQLCVLIEYHRNRCDLFKESISKLIVRFNKNTSTFSHI